MDPPIPGYSRNPCVLQESPRSKTSVRQKTVSPDWGQKLELLVDGAADPSKAGEPMVEIRVWHKAGPDGGGDMLVGRVRLPAAPIALAAARREAWGRAVKALEKRIVEFDGAGPGADPNGAAEAVLREKLAHVKRVRAEAGAKQERWEHLEWVEGCRADTRVDGEEAEDVGEAGVGVRGADHRLAILHVCVTAQLSEYQANALLNHYFHPLENAAEAARLELLQHTNAVSDALTALNIKPPAVLDKHTGRAQVNATQLARAIRDDNLRAGVQDALDKAARAFSNTARTTSRVPALPMRASHHVALSSTARLRKALAEAALFQQSAAAPKLFVAARMQVKLISGRNLPAMDKSGLSDPYVRLLIGNRFAISRNK